MKKLLILLAAILLVGCDYTTPLVTTPKISIDTSVLGLWQWVGDNNKIEQLLVLALDDKEYLVSYTSSEKEVTFARACLCKTDGKTLVQLKWLGNSDGKPPDGNRIYQFLSYSVSGNKLTVRFLNNEVVNKDAASPKELAKAIADNRNNPELFREPGVFTKVSQ